ncbi:MAG TPA: branched-chain amino acid ABC transporter permease [Actinomycetota bacterium]|jgi:branched-chain amino acid transport system permease protein|nr:branched-chain amino acid ABC transporter permease [Actinomycetota bacterium]
MAAPTAVAGKQRAEARAAALARLSARLRLPLVAAPAGALVGVVGSYLYWTVSTVRAEGVPLSGRLVDYGFAGVRTWSLLVSLVALVYGGLLLRSRSRTSTQGQALTRLGIGLAVVPVIWMLALVLFIPEGEFADIGPGPWVTLAGGALVWLAGRGLLRAPAAEAAAPWPRRSALVDLAVVVAAELAAFGVFLLGIAIDDPGEFLGFFTALTALATALSTLGVFKGLAGPFGRNEGLALALMAVLLLLFPFTQEGNTFWIQVTAQAGLFVLAALGLNIVVGSAGLLDLGYVAFFGIGAYTAALTGNALLTNVNFHIPFLLVVFFVAPAVAAFFGVLLGAPTLRLRGDYLAIVTLGFGEIVRITLNNLDPLTRGPNGISSIPDPVVGGWSMGEGFSLAGYEISGNAVYYYLLLFLIALTLSVIYRMNDSRIGRAWVAVREDEVAAAAMGINTTIIKLLAFGAGAWFAGMSGAVNAHLLTQVSPDSYTFPFSVLILAMVVLGGLGNPPGVVLGAIILTFLPEKLREFSDIRFLVFGFALVLIMRFRPEGLLPSARRRRELHATGETAAAESQQLFDVRSGT